MIWNLPFAKIDFENPIFTYCKEVKIEQKPLLLEVQKEEKSSQSSLHLDNYN